ncbi:MAG: hypothetical protein ACKOZY_10855, partial [Flavobacteriales bacterium]
LEYRVKQGVQWSTWSDISGRPSVYGQRFYETIEQGLLAELLWQARNNLYTQDDTLQWDAVLASQAYAASTYYVYKMEAYHQQPTPSASQLRIVYHPTPGMGGNHQQVVNDTLEFPIFLSTEP